MPEADKPQGSRALLRRVDKGGSASENGKAMWPRLGLARRRFKEGEEDEEVRKGVRFVVRARGKCACDAGVDDARCRVVHVQNV